MNITEEHLECSECNWLGFEEDAIPDGLEDDPGFRCPSCGAQCAHFPLDEIGLPFPESR